MKIIRQVNKGVQLAQRFSQAFTLAELLIALAILGVIATFAIPKVLNAQRDGKYNSLAKEAMAAVSEAYQAYQIQNVPPSNFGAASLIPYFNYVRIDTTSDFDNRPLLTPAVLNCSASQCLRLHNGGLLYIWPGVNMGGTTSLNHVTFMFDPDGKAGGNQDSLMFGLYYNGRVTSRAHFFAGSTSSAGSFGPIAGADPAWFSW